MRTAAFNPADLLTGMGAARAPGGTPKRDRASAMAAFAPLLRGGGEAGVGPESAASRTSRKLTDPLGLASEQAMTGAGGGAAPEAGPSGAAASTGSGNAPGDAGSSADSGPARSGSRDGRASDSGGSNKSPTTTTPEKDARQPVQDRGAPRQTEPQVQQGQARPANGRSRPEPSAPSARPNAAGKLSGVSPAQASGSGSTANTGRGAGPPGPVVTSVQSAAGGRSESLKQPAPAKQPTQVLRQEKAEVAPQLSKSLASLLMRQGGSVQIQLRPEALGRVQVDLTMQEGVVSATLDAETDSARQLLRSELDRLRSMLEHRGLRVERLEVVPSRAEREAPALNEQSPGGRWTPAQDDPGASGREAGDGSPWNGDRERAWGGDPGGHAERGRPGVTASAAESGEPGTGDVDASVWRSPGQVSIRLDAVA